MPRIHTIETFIHIINGSKNIYECWHNVTIFLSTARTILYHRMCVRISFSCNVCGAFTSFICWGVFVLVIIFTDMKFMKGKSLFIKHTSLSFPTPFLFMFAPFCHFGICTFHWSTHIVIRRYRFDFLAVVFVFPFHFIDLYRTICILCVRVCIL